MMNFIKNSIRFILNPILDDWNGGVSLMRLTFIATMYYVLQIIKNGGSIDWSLLIIILFEFIYICFKGEAPALIIKLLDTFASIKGSIVSQVTKSDVKPPDAE